MVAYIVMASAAAVAARALWDVASGFDEATSRSIAKHDLHWAHLAGMGVTAALRWASGALGLWAAVQVARLALVVAGGA